MSKTITRRLSATCSHRVPVTLIEFSDGTDTIDFTGCDLHADNGDPLDDEWVALAEAVHVGELTKAEADERWEALKRRDIYSLDEWVDDEDLTNEEWADHFNTKDEL